MDELISSTSRDLPGEEEKYINNNNNNDEDLAFRKCHDCVEEMAEETTSEIRSVGISGQNNSVLGADADCMEQYFENLENSRRDSLLQNGKPR